MRVIHLARKPLGAPTVGENVDQFGTGALNIGATRVGVESVATHSRGRSTAFPKRPGEVSVEASGRTQRQDIVDHGPRTGRWPSNLIFEHRPECRQTGVVKVPGTGIRGAVTVTRETDVRWKPHLNPRSKVATGRAQPVWGYTGPDGMESVMGWECAPGCPVAAVNEDTGIAGGVSRFFMQVGGQKE